MQTRFEQLPTVHVAGKKVVGRVLFGVLVLMAIAVGGTAGSLLVYSTGLPQVEELEHYRPSSVTQLYDDQNRVVGSFALQRRVIVTYDDFPKVLRESLISIEDKAFERHWAVNLWRIMGAAYRDVESARTMQTPPPLTIPPP